MLKDYTPAQLAALPELSPPYRARQVFSWLHQGVSSAQEMTDLPKALRDALDARYAVTRPAMLRRQISKDGTRKYLWGLADGNCVESVLMRYRHGLSACVSTQAGCRMGCAFCASAQGGLSRNLSPGEILDQIIFTGLDAGERVSHVVLMGSGEPLDNLDNVLRWLEIVGSPGGLCIGQRHISLSTSGLCDKIDALADLKLQITLSVSLHAPNDALRRQIMPVARANPMERLLAGCRRYAEITGRRVSYEYILIRDFNDSPDCAAELAARLSGTGSHVNLITLNHIAESPFQPSTRETVAEFLRILTQRGVNATLRRRLGYDIDASCGLLRQAYRKEHDPVASEYPPAAAPDQERDG